MTSYTRFYPLLAATGALLLVILACSNPTPNAPERTLPEAIHYYLYDNQPGNINDYNRWADDFVKWAKTDLSQYSARQVYRALQAEARVQVKAGHPNAIAYLSIAAQAWAEENNLQYNMSDWVSMQKESQKYLKEPAQNLQLWPENE